MRYARKIIPELPLSCSKYDFLEAAFLLFVSSSDESICLSISTRIISMLFHNSLS